MSFISSVYQQSILFCYICTIASFFFHPFLGCIFRHVKVNFLRRTSETIGNAFRFFPPSLSLSSSLFHKFENSFAFSFTFFSLSLSPYFEIKSPFFGP